MLQGSRHFFPLRLHSAVRSFSLTRQGGTRLSSTPSISHFLLFPAYRLCPLILSLTLSFSFSPSFSLFFPRLPSSLVPAPSSPSLRRIFTAFAQVCFPSLALRFDLASSVSLPRSYGSFVSLVISSYGHPRVSLRLSSRVLLAQVYLSSSNLVEGFRPVHSGIMSS